jgi:hypothetical protein
MNCLLINVKGIIRQSSIAKLTKEELCSKCGFKTHQYFEKIQNYSYGMNNEKFIIEIWGKDKSRSGNENKYQFPGSPGTQKIYGTCIIIRKDENENCVHLTTDVWTEIYTLLRSINPDNKSQESSIIASELELEEEEYTYNIN